MGLTNRARSFGQAETVRPSGTGAATLSVTVDVQLDQVELDVFAARLQETVRRSFALGVLAGLTDAEAEMSAEVDEAESAQGARTDS